MTLTANLTHLESVALVRLAAVRPELEYLFRHILIQDAAYNSLLKADRRVLHQLAGETLEQLHAPHLNELAATLAHHFERAGDTLRALTYFTQAGEEAARIFANDEALAFYRAALAQASQLANAGTMPIAPWQAHTAQLHEHIGDVCELTGKHAEALTHYTEALQAAPPTDVLKQAQVQRKMGRVWAVQSRHPEAVAAYAEAERLLGATPHETNVAWQREWIQIKLDLMTALYWRGQWQAVAQLVEQVRPIIQQYGTPALLVLFYDSLVGIEERRNRYIISAEVLDYTRAMLAASQESGNLRLIADAQFQMGFVLLLHDDFDEAEQQLRAAEQTMRRIGYAIFLVHVVTYLCMLYRRRGQFDRARECIQQALTLAEANQMTLGIARAQANLAWLRWREAKTNEAYQHGRTAIELWSRVSFADPFRWIGYLPLIALTLERGHIAESIEYARVLLEPTQRRLPNAIDTPLTQAVQHFEQGQIAEAQASLQQAVAAALQMNYL
jgi:tetratricopeptide (TPR) repeat protein